MLKPDTNLFFYSFQLYRGVDKPKNQKSPENKGIDIDKAYSRSQAELKESMKEALKDIKWESKNDKTPATKEYKKLIRKYRSDANEVLNKPKAKEKLRAMAKKTLKIITQIKERYMEAERIRENCKRTLEDQYTTEFKLAKGLLRAEVANLPEEIDSERYDYLVEAYLNRWYESYNKMFDNRNLTPNQIKALNTYIGRYNREGMPVVGFKDGPMKKDLDLAYDRMRKAVKLWAKEGEDTKKVYSNKYWAAPIKGNKINRFPRRKINGEKYRIGPLPDGTEFKDEKYPPTDNEKFRNKLTEQGIYLASKKTTEAVKESGPEITDVGVENGRLVINGKNIPQGSESIDLEFKSDLAAGLESGSADITTYALVLETMKSDIKTRIITKLTKDNIPTAEVNQILDDNEKLNELLGLPPRPVVKVKGRASLDGRFGYNKQLAMKRAKNAIKGLKDQYGDNYKFEPVAEVIGPNGEKVDTANQGYTKFKEEWNNEFPDKKIDSAAKMKNLINSYARGTAKNLTNLQKKWLRQRIDMVRGVQATVTGDTPDKIKIQYNNTKEQEPIAQA